MPDELNDRAAETQRDVRIPSVLWTGLLLVLVTGLVTLAVVIRDRRDAARLVTLTIIGTNDLHGAVEPVEGRGGLDVFGGYVANVRAARQADGGGVVLVDAGDMFSGSSAADLTEGAVVLNAYNALGYSAVTVGEADFAHGAFGPDPTTPDDTRDPRGVLKARAAGAYFPLLASNLVEVATWRPIAWPNVRRSMLTEVAGVQVGFVGVTNADLASLTSSANMAGLAVAPLAPTIALEAARLRTDGADVVIVLAHAGAAAMADVAGVLPAGLVDVIVAGHTHEATVREVSGTAMIESLSDGRAFGRVDLVFDPDTRQVVSRRLAEPRDVCALVAVGSERCDSPDSDTVMVQASYEGRPVTPVVAIDAIIASAVRAAQSPPAP